MDSRDMMIYFIVNNTARTGKSRAIWLEMKELLENRSIEYKAYQTKYAGHATELARKISSLPEDRIYLITVGGDGTLNEVINGISDFSRIVLGILPIGSGNDFARGMGISRDTLANLEQILDLIESDSEGTAIDLGEVSCEALDTPKYFAISSGAGLDAIVCKKALHSRLKKFLNHLHLGKLTYLLLTVESLFSMTTCDADIVFDHGETMHVSHIIFAAGMNLRAEGGGVPMAPDAVPDDGMLCLGMAHDVPKWLTFFLLPFLVAGKQKYIKAFECIPFKECALHLSGSMTVHADGEYCGENTTITYKCLPGKLHFLKVS